MFLSGIGVQRANSFHKSNHFQEIYSRAERKTERFTFKRKKKNPSTYPFNKTRHLNNSDWQQR